MTLNLERLRTLEPAGIRNDTLDEIFQRRLALFQQEIPEWTYTPDDPWGRWLWVASLDEFQQQQRNNRDIYSNHAIFASGDTLELFLAEKGLTPRDGESTESQRERYYSANQALAPGSLDAIRASTYDASPDVIDVALVIGTDGRTTTIYIKSSGSPPAGEQQGLPTDTLIATVLAYVSQDTRTPPRKHAGDVYIVAAPTATVYTVTAVLHYLPDQDGATVLERGRVALQAFAAAGQPIGHGLYLDQLRRVLLVDGVEYVELTAPAANVAATATRFFALDYAASTLTAETI